MLSLALIIFLWFKLPFFFQSGKKKLTQQNTITEQGWHKPDTTKIPHTKKVTWFVMVAT